MRFRGCCFFPILLAWCFPMSAAVQNTKFENFTAEFTREILALQPVSATTAGYHRHTDRRTGRTLVLDEILDDESPAGQQHRREVLDELERELSRFSSASLGQQEQIDYRIMRRAIEQERFELDRIQAYKHNPTLYTNTLGFAIFQPMVEEYGPLEVRLGHIFARLQKMPAYLADARRNLVDTDPVYTQAAAEGADGIVGLLQNQLKQLVDQSGNASLRMRYAQLLPGSVAELQSFRRYLTDELAKHSTGSWRLGPVLYREKLRLALDTDMTPEDLLARAERRLGEVRATMLETALPLHRELFPAHGDHTELSAGARGNQIIREVLEQIAAVHPGRDGLMDQVRHDLADIRRFITEKQIVALPPGKNLQVIETPPFIRSSYGVAGLAPAPPLEPRLGAFYWVTPIPKDWPAERVESKLREYNRYTLLILTMHEALPGHYVQFEDANRLDPEARRALRCVFANGPYVEGWATYGETLMLDAGFLDGSSKLKLMHQKWELRGIANAILDVRMHTMNMSDAEALDLMENQTFQEAAEAEAKLTRAKLSSTQLPTYFLGWTGWRDIRVEREHKLGASFRLKDFLDQALAVGPIPLPELKQLFATKATASRPAASFHSGETE